MCRIGRAQATPLSRTCIVLATGMSETNYNRELRSELCVSLYTNVQLPDEYATPVSSETVLCCIARCHKVGMLAPMYSPGQGIVPRVWKVSHLA
jgi:hypothetical protein